MSDMVRGTVLGVDRDTGTVRAEIAGVVVPAAPYLGDPPWPLSACWFFNAPAYTCLGPIGNKRVAFADDFNFYTSGTPLIGGTGWTAGGTPGSLSTPNNPTDANGVLRIASASSSARYFIRKTLQMVTLTDTRVYWMTARVRSSDINQSMTVGLSDSNVMTGGGAASTDASARVTLSSLGGSSISIGTNAGASSGGGVSTGSLLVADTWVWVDLMVAGGQWVAAWVDGSGPWVTTDAVPSTSQDSVTPHITAYYLTGTFNVDVDYVSLAQVDLTTTADPTTFGELDPVDVRT